MATKTAKRPEAKPATTEETPDAPLIDATGAAIKKLVLKGKERGYVTYDELNDALPPDEVSSEQIEDAMARLSEIGVNVVEEEEETEEPAEAAEEQERGDSETVSRAAAAPRSRARPHRRSGAHVSARDGQRRAAVARGRDRDRQAHRGRPRADDRRACARARSPTVPSCNGAKRLKEGQMLLRDIIDLEATYGGAAGSSTTAAGGRLRRGRATTPRRPRARAEGDADGEDGEANVSLAAMEEAAEAGGARGVRQRRQHLQEAPEAAAKRLAAMLARGEAISRSRAKRYEKLSEELVAAMGEVRLNNGRIEQLVEQLYELNRKLIGLEGRLLRLATSRRVKRERLPRPLSRPRARSATGCRRSSQLTGTRLEEVRRPPSRRHQGDPRADIAEIARRGRPADRRVPPRRRTGPEGRARGQPGEEGDGRGQPAPRDLDRQEVHQPRPAVPRPDPGRQHRPDEGGRQVRVPPRLQVLDLRHVVDPPGDHPLDRRPGAHHPHPGAHDRDDQQAGAHPPPDAARDRPRADAGGTGRASSACRSRRCARC